MQKIIVTGGLGFIGSNLIELLLRDRYFVINIDKVSYASNYYNCCDCFTHRVVDGSNNGWKTWIKTQRKKPY